MTSLAGFRNLGYARVLQHCALHHCSLNTWYTECFVCVFVCPCVMTYTHPNLVGVIYPRGMKLALLIWTGRLTECGSRVTLNPQPPAADTKLLCIQLREVCCACQHGLFPLLTFDNLIDLYIDRRLEIGWKCWWTSFVWVRMVFAGPGFCMR